MALSDHEQISFKKALSMLAALFFDKTVL